MTNYPVAVLVEQRPIAILQNAPQVAVPMSAVHPVGPKGDPGGNIMSIGLFEDASAIEVPDGTDVVRTSGWDEIGKGIADYFADPAVDAAYVAAYPRASFLDTEGRGFRLAGPNYNVHQFGATGEGVTNDGAAFLAAIAYLKSLALADYNVDSPYRAMARLYIPAGHYYLGSNTLDFNYTVILEGDSSGLPGGRASFLRWAAGTTGIRTQRYNTSGASTVDGVGHSGADGSIIRQLSLQGAYSGTEGDYFGIHAKTRVVIEHCMIDSFQGDGIYLQGLGDGDGGNVNNFRVDTCAIYRCRKGIYIEGGDANAGITIGVDVTVNRSDGIHDSSFLGNVHIMPHAAGNGGAPYRTDNVNTRSVFINPYVEAGDDAPEIVAPSIIIGGSLQSGYSVGDAIHMNPDFDTGAAVFPNPIKSFGQYSNPDIASWIGYNGWFSYWEDGTNGWQWKPDTGDLLLTRANSIELIGITGSATARTFGRTGEPVADMPFVSALALGGRTITRASDPPASGYHAQGEIILYASPSPGGAIGWVCTTAGTPGTWKTWGTIAA